MLKIKQIQVIDCWDWDDLVQETYGLPYIFQQQEGCQSRGIVNINIPDESYDEEMNDDIPEVVNGDIMGVKFEKWLARDPKTPIKNQKYDDELRLFWERNFYPDLQTVANDLHKKGLIEAGQYSINIDW